MVFETVVAQGIKSPFCQDISAGVSSEFGQENGLCQGLFQDDVHRVPVDLPNRHIFVVPGNCRTDLFACPFQGKDNIVRCHLISFGLRAWVKEDALFEMKGPDLFSVDDFRFGYVFRKIRFQFVFSGPIPQ